MEILAVVWIAMLSLPAAAQRYSFAKTFVEGSVWFNDGTRKAGQVEWFPHQN